MTRTIVLGLDGANWALLEPWLRDGLLPNIEALRSDGVHADMESCLPPVTCPNWRCYSTGKNPGKLGVFWWERIDTDSRTLSTPDSRSFRSANYWDYLNDEGHAVGVMNLPMTYPPFEIDGWMVAGGPGSEQDEYTWPPALGEELDERGYRVHPETPVTSSEDVDAVEGVISLIDGRFRTFRRLLDERPVDVAHLTIFYVNVLQHFFWRDDPTRRAWEVIDEHVGAIRDAYPDATLLLMSDHGCTEIDTVFYANSWLEREGYLVTRADATDLLSRFGVNKERVSRVAHRLGIHGLVVSLTPEWLKASVPDSDEGFKRERKLDKVDWERSRAITSGQGLVYVTEDHPATIEGLVSDLESLESDLTGESIATSVLTAEEAFDGPYLDDAPDVVFDQQPGVHTSGAIGDNPVFLETGRWRAENVRTGLFLGTGPDVTATAIDGPISITDLAPTVLRSLDCAVPDDLDGEPLPLFDEDAVVYREPIPFAEVDSASGGDVQERLADLGYLE